MESRLGYGDRKRCCLMGTVSIEKDESIQDSEDIHTTIQIYLKLKIFIIIVIIIGPGAKVQGGRALTLHRTDSCLIPGIPDGPPRNNS